MRFRKSGKYFINTLVKCLLLLTFGCGLSLWVYKFYRLETRDQFLGPGLTYVSGISIEGTPIMGFPTTISIEGSHANYCGRIHSHEIDVNERDKLVNITLWSWYILRMCLQAVKSFTYEVIFIFPSGGNWTIACNRIAVNTTVLG